LTGKNRRDEMKRYLWMMIATLLAVPGGAYAGFFGPSAPEGSVELKMSDDVGIYVKDGFVFPSVPWFVYDSNSHLAAFAAGAGPVGRAQANSRNHIKRANEYGQVAIIKDEEIRGIFDSMAAKPQLWAKYLEGGDDSCTNEKALLAELKFKAKVKGNLIAASCTGLKTKVDAVLGGLDASEKQIISGGDTERGKIIADHGLLPAIGTPFKAEHGIAAIKQANKPETVASIAALLADLPPEGEIIPLIERKEMVATGETRRIPPTTLGSGRTVAVEKEQTWKESSILPHDVFKTPEAQAFLGNLAYTESGDFIVDQLRNFDYPLSNPAFNPNFAAESRLSWLTGPKVMMVKSYVPRPMYAWSIFKNNQQGLSTEEANWISGQEGVGRFLSFPFLSDVGLPEYKTAWITWHKMLQKDQMSADELRKLVLLADLVSGGKMNGQFQVVADPFKAKRTKPMEAVKYSSFMGYFAAKAVAPVNMRAINLPSEWDVANYQTQNPDDSNPGLTVGRWYVSVLAAAPEKANANPDFVAFTKALFAGDVAGCRAVINKAVTDADLAKVGMKAKSDLSKADLPDTVKLRFGEALANNPTALYKHLGDSIAQIYHPGGSK
jgi:hypothetical protein